MASPAGEREFQHSKANHSSDASQCAPRGMLPVSRFLELAENPIQSALSWDADEDEVSLSPCFASLFTSSIDGSRRLRPILEGALAPVCVAPALDTFAAIARSGGPGQRSASWAPSALSLEVEATRADGSSCPARLSVAPFSEHSRQVVATLLMIGREPSPEPSSDRPMPMEVSGACTASGFPARTTIDSGASGGKRPLPDALPVATTDSLKRARASSSPSLPVGWTEKFVTAASVPIFGVDSDGTLNAWNPAASRLFGFEEDEALGRSLSDLIIAPSSVELMADVLQDSLQGKPSGNIELEAVSRSQQRLNLLMSATALSSGGHAGYMAVCQDITALRKAPAPVSALDDMNAIIIDVDKNGVVTRWNARATEVLGFLSEEAVGKPLIPTFIKPDVCNLIDDAIQRTLQHGSRAFSLSLTMCNKLQQEVFLLISMGPSRDDCGDIVGALMVMQDITETRMAMQAELEISKATAASVAKNQFLANMSHEMRTPLNGILGVNQMLMSTNLTDEQCELAELVQTSAEHLLRLISDILDLTRIESGQLQLKSEPFKIFEALEETLDNITMSASNKGLEIVSIFDESIDAIIVADSNRIKQVLLNLLTNAVKFTQAGEIMLSVENASSSEGRLDKLLFKVSDSGIGISEGDKTNLFQYFTQLDSSTTRGYGGSGLGLAICKQLVRLMEGDMGVDSAPGAGSTFWFTIPVKTELAMPKAKISGMKTVLACTNNEAERVMLRNYLKSWGLQTTFVHSLDESLQMLRAKPDNFDVLVTSIHAISGNMVETEFQKFVQYASVASKAVQMHAILSPLPLVVRIRNSIASCSVVIKPVKRSTLLAALGANKEYTNTSSVFPAAADLNMEHTQDHAVIGDNAISRVLVVEESSSMQHAMRRAIQKAGFVCDVVSHGMGALDALDKIRYKLILIAVPLAVMDGTTTAIEIRKLEKAAGWPQVPIIGITGRSKHRADCLLSGMDDVIQKPIGPETLARIVQEWVKYSDSQCANLDATFPSPAQPGSAPSGRCSAAIPVEINSTYPQPYAIHTDPASALGSHDLSHRKISMADCGISLQNRVQSVHELAPQAGESSGAATIKPIQPAYDGISRGGRKSRGTRTGTAILVAEDSLASQMALKRTIKKAFRLLNKPEPVIRIVGDGSEAAQALMNKKFNIVFTDIFMPNMTGTQLLQSIREKFSADELPVVALTSAADGNDGMTGFSAVEGKTISAERLGKLIEELLSTRGRMSESEGRNLEAARSEPIPLEEAQTAVVQPHDSAPTIHLTFADKHGDQTRHRILISTCDKMRHLILKCSLKKALKECGAQSSDIVTCSTGPEMLYELSKQHFDLVLMDFQLLDSVDDNNLRAAQKRSPTMAMIALTPTEEPLPQSLHGIFCHSLKISSADLHMKALVQRHLLKGSWHVDQRPRRESVASWGARPADVQNAHTCLVAEDNHTAMLIMTRMLEKENINVIPVENGAKAVEARKTCKIDLIFMDCNMPIMDGWQATREIRAWEDDLGYKRIPIIAVTANAMDGDREGCLACGMDDYIPKPVRKWLITDMLMKWLPMAHGPTTESNVSTDVTWNRSEMQPRSVTEIQPTVAAPGGAAFLAKNLMPQTHAEDTMRRSSSTERPDQPQSSNDTSLPGSRRLVEHPVLKDYDAMEIDQHAGRPLNQSRREPALRGVKKVKQQNLMETESVSEQERQTKQPTQVLIFSDNISLMVLMDGMLSNAGVSVDAAVNISQVRALSRQRDAPYSLAIISDDMVLQSTEAAVSDLKELSISNVVLLESPGKAKGPGPTPQGFAAKLRLPVTSLRLMAVLNACGISALPLLTPHGASGLENRQMNAMAHKRILHVDGSPAMHLAVSTLLSPYGMTVVATTPSELEKCTLNAFDAVLVGTDVSLSASWDAMRQACAVPLLSVASERLGHAPLTQHEDCGTEFCWLRLLRELLGALKSTPDAVIDTSRFYPPAPVNLEEVLPMYEGDWEFVLSLLSCFLSNGRAQVNEAFDVCSKHNIARLKFLAHALLGAGRSCGLQAASNVFSSLEQLCKAALDGEGMSPVHLSALCCAAQECFASAHRFYDRVSKFEVLDLAQGLQSVGGDYAAVVDILSRAGVASSAALNGSTNEPGSAAREALLSFPRLEALAPKLYAAAVLHSTTTDLPTAEQQLAALIDRFHDEAMELLGSERLEA